METSICSFTGEYDFLSNFFEIPLEYKGYIFTSTEAAFMAEKSGDPQDLQRFSEYLPSKAKREGRKVNLRSDWEDVKIPIMKTIVKAKFDQHKELKEKLLATKDRELIEGNHWNDTFWGICNGVGQNNLGLILMEIRNEMASKI